MDNKYDVVIVGAGIGGLMAAYGLKMRNNDLKIAIIDKGKLLEDRYCPSANGEACKNCKVCSITSGLAGAGAFSDGKFSLGTSYGGTLGEEIGDDAAFGYICAANEVINYFTPDETVIDVYGTDDKLKLKCTQNNLRLLDMSIKHLGTDNNYKIMSRLIKWLFNHYVDFVVEETIKYINKYDDGYHIASSKHTFLSNKVILATGRNGADFIHNVCHEFNIPVTSNAVDIGVRVEMDDSIWREFSSKIYEPKIVYRTKTFEDRTRMFCFNQGGIVSAENNDGVITANGHAFADPDKKTSNCNFAILSSIKFTEPFNDPTTYAKSFSKMANLIGNGNVLVQRFGDLVRGRRTNEHRLAQNSVKPTLKATAGDISLALPHRILTNIIETIYALDKVAPGTANDDTLLYGLESKYYSIKPKHDENFMIYPGMYLIGDGSGIARGLSQSAAMGLYVAEKISEES